MINVQTLLNDMYYKHGYQHSTYYDSGKYRTSLYNPNQPKLYFAIEHDNIENCEFIVMREICDFPYKARSRKLKTLNGVVNRIKKLETIVVY